MGRFGWEQPGFEVLHQLIFSRGFLDLRKPGQVGVTAQFGWNGPPCAQEKKRQFLKASSALQPKQPRPPFRAGKILARKRKFLEVIFEQ